MTTTQNAELMDVEYSPPNAALEMAYKRTQLEAFDLDELKKADKEVLTKMMDLDIDLSDADVDSEDIDEALAMVKKYAQLKTLRLKMPKLGL